MSAKAPPALLIEDTPCPLCLSGQTSFFHEDARRLYIRCSNCWLVFVPTGQLPTAAEEKAQYDLHCNNPNDGGYRQFLQRALEPVVKYVTPPASGLDFGCGPGPTLSVMLTEQGYTVADYDPVYFNHTALLDQQYDFVTCTEVIEHVHAPAKIWALLKRLLKTDGLLVIMTKRVISDQAFANWHYKNDPTHVRFYSLQTFEYLAGLLGLSLTVCSDDVVVFHRSG